MSKDPLEKYRAKYKKLYGERNKKIVRVPPPKPNNPALAFKGVGESLGEDKAQILPDENKGTPVVPPDQSPQETGILNVPRPRFYGMESEPSVETYKPTPRLPDLEYPDKQWMTKNDPRVVVEDGRKKTVLVETSEPRGEIPNIVDKQIPQGQIIDTKEAQRQYRERTQKGLDKMAENMLNSVYTPIKEGVQRYFGLEQKLLKGESIGNPAEELADRLLGGAQTIINLFPGMVGVNAIQPMINGITHRIATDMIGESEEANKFGEWLGHATSLSMFGKKVLMAGLTSQTLSDFASKIINQTDLSEENKSRIIEFVSHAGFFTGLSLAKGKGSYFVKKAVALGKQFEKTPLTQKEPKLTQEESKLTQQEPPLKSEDHTINLLTRDLEVKANEIDNAATPDERLKAINDHEKITSKIEELKKRRENSKDKSEDLKNGEEPESNPINTETEISDNIVADKNKATDDMVKTALENFEVEWKQKKGKEPLTPIDLHSESKPTQKLIDDANKKIDLHNKKLERLKSKESNNSLDLDSNKEKSKKVPVNRKKDSEKTKNKSNAIQKQSPDEGLLRKEEPEVGLQEVDNAHPPVKNVRDKEISTTQEASKQKEIEVLTDKDFDDRINNVYDRMALTSRIDKQKEFQDELEDLVRPKNKIIKTDAGFEVITSAKEDGTMQRQRFKSEQEAKEFINKGRTEAPQKPQKPKTEAKLSKVSPKKTKALKAEKNADTGEGKLNTPETDLFGYKKNIDILTKEFPSNSYKLEVMELLRTTSEEPLGKEFAQAYLKGVNVIKKDAKATANAKAIASNKEILKSIRSEATRKTDVAKTKKSTTEKTSPKEPRYISKKSGKEEGTPKTKAEERVKKARNELNRPPSDISMNPVDWYARHIKNLAIVGAHHLAKTGRRFGKWAKAMIEDLGQRIRPYLRKIWKSNELKNLEEEIVKAAALLREGQKTSMRKAGIDKPKTKSPLTEQEREEADYKEALEKWYDTADEFNRKVHALDDFSDPRYLKLLREIIAKAYTIFADIPRVDKNKLTDLLDDVDSLEALKLDSKEAKGKGELKVQKIGIDLFKTITGKNLPIKTDTDNIQSLFSALAKKDLEDIGSKVDTQEKMVNDLLESYSAIQKETPNPNQKKKLAQIAELLKITEEVYKRAKDNLGKSDFGKMNALPFGEWGKKARDLMIMGLYHIQHIDKYSDWVRRMVKDTSPKIIGGIKKIWHATRELYQAKIEAISKKIAETPAETVRSFSTKQLKDLAKKPLPLENPLLPKGIKSLYRRLSQVVKPESQLKIRKQIQELLNTGIINFDALVQSSQIQQMVLDLLKTRKSSKEEIAKGEKVIKIYGIREADILKDKPSSVKEADYLNAVSILFARAMKTLYENAKDPDFPKASLVRNRAKLEGMKAWFRNSKAESNAIIKSVQSRYKEDYLDIADKIREQALKGTEDKFIEETTSTFRTKKAIIERIFYESLLSGLGTDLANTIANIGHIGWETLGLSLSQNPITTIKMFKRMEEALPIAIRKAKEILTQGAEAESKFDPQGQPYVPLFIPRSLTGRIVRGALPTTRLAAADAFSRVIAGAMRLDATYKDIQRETGDPIDRVLATLNLINKRSDLADIPKHEIYKKHIEAYEKYIDHIVFQTKLSPTMNAIQQTTNIGWGKSFKLLIPFLRIGTNILKANVKNTPLGLVSLRNWNKMTRSERKDVFRRALMGTAFIGGMLELSRTGTIEVTGSGPTDQKKRDLWRKMGYRENHIYIRDGEGNLNGVPYALFNPVNVVLSVIGNINDQAKWGTKAPERENSDFNKAMDILLGTASTITAASFMTGIRDALEVLRLGDEYRFIDMLQSVLTPSILGTPKETKRLVKDEAPILKKKETSSISQRVVDNLELKIGLGLDDEIPNRLNFFGEPISSTYERHPFRISTVKNKMDDSVYQEILSMYEKTSDNSAIPPKVSNQFSYKDQKHELTGRQEEIYTRIVGQARKRFVRALINNEIKIDVGTKSKYYSEMTETEKLAALNKAYSKGLEEGQKKYMTLEQNKKDKKEVNASKKNFNIQRYLQDSLNFNYER